MTGVQNKISSIVAVLIICVAFFQIRAQTRGVKETVTKLGEIPVTILQKSNNAPAPAVVIAHGFSGSQQLMADRKSVV